MKFRLVPRLDIKNNDLVKGVKMEGLRVLGDPSVFCLSYNGQHVDELMLFDTVASLYGRNNLDSVVTMVANEASTPLLIGGGIRTCEDVRNALTKGADRIFLNTAALNDPKIIDQMVSEFGSSTISVSIDASFQDGRYVALADCGREVFDIDIVAWMEEVVDRGAGELVVTSVDREGTEKGFDQRLLELIPQDLSVPVLFGGGCSEAMDVVQIAKNYDHVSGVLIGSWAHYSTILNQQPNKLAEREGNTYFLNSLVNHRVELGPYVTEPFLELRNKLSSHGIELRE